MTLSQNSIRLLLCLCMPLGLLAIGCNQSAENPEAVSSNSSTALASPTEGCCADTSSKQGGCAQCAGTQVVAKKADACGDCTACAEGNSEACKCGDEQAVVAKKDGCGDCTACAEGDSAACKCGAGTSEELSEKPSEKPSEKTTAHAGGVSDFANDRDVFHYLLSNNEKITRRVVELDDGVETFTESDDPAIVAKIQEHVAAMYQRVENVQPIRMRDPLYREIFKHTDKIEMKLENTEQGIHVTETSEDEYVVKLIQSHAKVVSGFVEHGFEEARKNHELPQ